MRDPITQLNGIYNEKIIAVSLLSLVSSTAIAGVESLYVSGKMGASIVQVSNQKWLTSDNEFEKTNLGNTHDSVSVAISPSVMTLLKPLSYLSVLNLNLA